MPGEDFFIRFYHGHAGDAVREKFLQACLNIQEQPEVVDVQSCSCACPRLPRKHVMFICTARWGLAHG